MLTPAELVWLIAAVAKGDEAAFERLYAATRAKLFGVVLRILRRQDLAEEVIQAAYVKIWNSAGQYNPALSSPSTWMAVAANQRRKLAWWMDMSSDRQDQGAKIKATPEARTTSDRTMTMGPSSRNIMAGGPLRWYSWSPR